MRTFAACLILTLIAINTAFAGKPIARCVNNEGELIFTDYLCETSETGQNPLLMTETATNPSVRARIPSVVKADAIATSKLKSATAEAQAQCQQRFSKYFKRKHPSIDTVPNVEFTQVVDQFMKGSDISVSLSGALEYVNDNYAVNSSVECTVQRFNPSSDWLVGFRER